VGEANRGLEYMFIMMNEARFAVGMEGLALSERAYQQALAYAKDRIQGTEAGVRGGPKVSIIHHPDVRRMLMSMKSQIEAQRALAYVVGAATDMAHHHPDEAVRAQNQAFMDLMIPVVKGWLTEASIEITSTGVQVHGGMGFIEETGAAQHFRDARITSIYEGTTAIQANDLIGRKIAREGGQTVKLAIAEMRRVEAQLSEAAGRRVRRHPQVAFRRRDGTGRGGCLHRRHLRCKDIKAASVGSVPFLKLLGIVAGGWQMGACRAGVGPPSGRGRWRCILLQGQDHHRALLRRPCAGSGAGPGLLGGQWCRGRAGADGRPVLIDGSQR
jgi:hypothetical protein